MIREAIQLSRRTARSAGCVMPSLRAVWSRLWVPMRRPALPGQLETPASTNAPAAVQPAVKPRQLRPIIVPASLDELHGPSSGLINPPRRLWWSGDEDTKFDLGDRGQAMELYEAIFEAARTQQDIIDHLDARLLIELWPELGMRRATKQAWEAAHPALAAAAAASHAA